MSSQWKSKIGMHLICKNEGGTNGHLDRCLGSMQGLWDEGCLVICDTGSTDDTVQVAEKYGAHVVHFEWCDNFGKARNYALEELYKHAPDIDYVMWVDADDAITDPINIPRLRQACDDYLDNPNVEGINCVYIYAKEEGALSFEGIPSFKYPRLRVFKRGKGYWCGAIHEYIQSDCTKHVNRHDIIFDHLREGTGKMNTERNLRIFRKIISEASPEELPRLKFYFAKECTYNGLNDEAIEAFLEYLPLSKWMPEKHRAMYELSVCYQKQGDIEKSREFAFKAITFNPKYVDPYIQLAILAYNEKDWKMCYNWTKMADNLDSPEVYFFDYIPYHTYVKYDYMAIALYNLNQKEQGLEYIEKCLFYKPHDGRFLYNWYVFNRDLNRLKKTSIIIPTHNRKEKLINCLKHIQENIIIGPEYYNILIGVDGNDNYYNELKEELPELFKNINISIKLYKEKSTVPRIVEDLVDTVPEDNYVCFLGDDTECKQGFLIHAMRASQNQKLVAFNDTVTTGECQHWIAPKSLRKKLGGEFFHRTYGHVSCDNELKMKAEKLNLFQFEPTAIVFHQHFIEGICSDKSRVSEMDETYSIGWNPESVKKDRELLARRIKNNFISDNEEIYINIGSGYGSPKYSQEELNKYISIDKFSEKATIQKDILEPNLFNDNTIDRILCEHVLEHLHSSEGEKLIKILYDALKPGGELEISCPDVGHIEEVKDKDYALKVMYGWRTCGEGMFHLFGYTEQSLVELLKKNGFNILSVENLWEYDAPAIRIFASK